MRLRTFSGRDMPSAMRAVREALGEDAIILNTGKDKSGMVTVTAAIDQDRDELPPAPAKPEPRIAPPPPRENLRSSATDALRYELQGALRYHNVPELFIAKMVQRLEGAELASIHALHRSGGKHSKIPPLQLAMEKLLESYFDFEPLEFSSLHEKGKKIMLIGQPGAGKTLSVAKMAARLSMDKQPFSVITTDTQRAGGIGQLQAFTQILGVPLHIAKNRKELAALLKDEDIEGRVLIDTAGCNPFAPGELDELQLLASLPGIEPILVMPAGGDGMEAIDVAEAFCALPVRRLMVTRADMARRFGGALAAAAAHSLAFCQTGRSASPIDALEFLTPVLLAQLLLSHAQDNAALPAYQLQTP